MFLILHQVLIFLKWNLSLGNGLNQNISKMKQSIHLSLMVLRQCLRMGIQWCLYLIEMEKSLPQIYLLLKKWVKNGARQSRCQNM